MFKNQQIGTGKNNFTQANIPKTEEILQQRLEKIIPLALWIGIEPNILSIQDPVKKWQMLDGYIMFMLRLKIAARNRQLKTSTQVMISNMTEKLSHFCKDNYSLDSKVWIRLFELNDGIWSGDSKITGDALAIYDFYLSLIKDAKSNQQAYDLLDKYHWEVS